MPSFFDSAVVTAISPMVLMVVRNMEVSGSMPSTMAAASTGTPKETMIEVRQTKEPPGTPGAPMDRATTVMKSAHIKAGVISTPYIFASRIVCGDCGGYFGSKVWHSNDRYRRVIWRCNGKYGEGKTKEERCATPHVTEFEIIASKIWSMGAAVLVSATLSVVVVIKGMMHVPIGGSIVLFTCGLALHLFAVTSMGIFLACIAQSMPQLGMLFILVLIPMQMLSGGMTPRESMPQAIQLIMNFAPTTHFVQFSQAILYRGAGFDVVWKPFLWLAAIGAVLFIGSLARFRKSVA